jgi:hypothetical protein
MIMDIGLIEKVRLAIVSPSDLFQKVKPEKGIFNAFKYLALLSLVTLITQFLSNALVMPHFFGINEILALTNANLPSFLIVTLPFVIYFLSLIFSFIGVGIIHVFSKLLKGNGNYAATYKTLIYSSTPSILFGWIPVIGGFINFYSLYLSVIGLARFHKISVERAAVIVIVIPFSIILFIGVAIASLLGFI